MPVTLTFLGHAGFLLEDGSHADFGCNFGQNGAGRPPRNRPE